MIVDIEQIKLRLAAIIGEDVESDRERDNQQWEINHFGPLECSSCGVVAQTRGRFIIWASGRDIVLCGDCCETVINGMNRDLAELLGYEEAKGKKRELYGVKWLLERISALQVKNIDLLRRVVALERALSGRTDD